MVCEALCVKICRYPSDMLGDHLKYFVIFTTISLSEDCQSVVCQRGQPYTESHSFARQASYQEELQSREEHSQKNEHQ